ncbi:chorismate-binding protein [Arthrobacter monumenti]
MNDGKSPRPLIIAIDGRSGAGKTTLAVELVARLREYHSVSLFHLEDIYPGWNGLPAGLETYRETVLTPLSLGNDAHWNPWDWEAGAEGAARCTRAAGIVVVEGVGAAHQQARALVDVVIWLEALESDRKQRALARDGDLFAPYWDQWAEQEAALLELDDVAAAADLVVQGPGDDMVREQVVAALVTLPQAEALLLPERTRWNSVSLRMQRLDLFPDAALCFSELYGGNPRTVWLDSSDSGSGHSSSRFSIMADDGGSYGRAATHSSGLTEVRSGAVSSRIRGPFFRWLDSVWGHGTLTAPDDYPGEFTLGWLGCLGYELKRETGGADIESSTPDAALIFTGRCLVFDHAQRCIYLLALEDEATHAEAAEWLGHTADRVAHLPAPAKGTSAEPRPVLTQAAAPDDQDPAVLAGNPALRFEVRNPRKDYLDRIDSARKQIAEGNSYEICLTTQLDCRPDSPIDPWQTYLDLRHRSPAPFAAYVQLDGLSVASTSPERFLRIGADGSLRAEPIKGTRRRDPDPGRDAALRKELSNSLKDRAENIMIVDLLRNDLSHFAVPDSLRVSRLCAVESYATVHQLVSTIDARLRPGADRAAAVAAAFPAGSMTGAPKISTMSILDDLEKLPRGIYSGALGYFSLNGAADLSVVIRSLVIEDGADGQRLSLGVGGAITADSNPESEWEEVQTKAYGVLSALGAEFPPDARPGGQA